MIHPVADLNELRDDLHAERRWNAAAREDIEALLAENLRLSQEATVLRSQVRDLQRDLTAMRRAELAQLFGTHIARHVA